MISRNGAVQNRVCAGTRLPPVQNRPLIRPVDAMRTEPTAAEAPTAARWRRDWPSGPSGRYPSCISRVRARAPRTCSLPTPLRLTQRSAE